MNLAQSIKTNNERREDDIKKLERAKALDEIFKYNETKRKFHDKFVFDDNEG